MKKQNQTLEFKMVDNSFLQSKPSNTFILKTKGNFLWRI